MLIKEDLLKKLIESKIRQKKHINEAPEDRERRKNRRNKNKERRKERRAELKLASSPEEKMAVRKKYREERKEDRDADRFEIDDPGVSLNDMLDPGYSDDTVYLLIVGMVNEVIPGIEEINQKYKGLKLVRRLKSRKEQKVTVGQVKRFIKNGLTLTLEKNYLKAADAFCAASVFLENPKSPDLGAVNIDKFIIDKLSEICSILGEGDFNKKGKGSAQKKGGGKKTGNTACVKGIQTLLNQINKDSQTLQPLKVDGKWGKLTTGMWREVILTFLQPGNVYNGNEVNDDIIKTILSDWPTGSKLIGFEGNPCGAEEFLKVMADKIKDGGEKPAEIKKDSTWPSRRGGFKKERIKPYDFLKPGGPGLSIDYFYSMSEFKQAYPGETFWDFIQTGGEGSYTEVGTMSGWGNQDVERSASPLEHDTSMLISNDAYYFDENTGNILFDIAGADNVMKGFAVVDDVIKYVGDKNLKEHKEMYINEKNLRKLIRENYEKRLIRENEKKKNRIRDFFQKGKPSKAYKEKMKAKGIDLDQIQAINDRAKQTAMTKDALDMIDLDTLPEAEALTPEKVLAAIDPEQKQQGKAQAIKKVSKKSGNNKVKEVQNLLNTLNNSEPKLTIDGKWGNNTTISWEKVLNTNTGKLRVLKGKAFTTGEKGDIKKKWPELAPMLSGEKQQFTGDIDGIINLLKYLVGGGKSAKQQGKSQEIKKEASTSWSLLREKSGGRKEMKSSEVTNLLSTGKFSTQFVYTPEEYARYSKNFINDIKSLKQINAQSLKRVGPSIGTVIYPGQSNARPSSASMDTAMIYFEKEKILAIDTSNIRLFGDSNIVLKDIHLTGDKKFLVSKSKKKA